MASFGWGDKRHENGMHELSSSPKRPFAFPQIACRICDQVFFSTQALINHIETHIVENESVFASRRQHDDQLTLAQRVFLENQRNHFLLHGSPTARLPRQVQVPPSLGMLGAQLSPNYKPTLVERRMAAAEPAVDLTKPFLDQLQQIKIPENHQMERKRRKNNVSETLDLTLKL